MWRITRFISVDLNEAADVGQDDEDEPVFTLEEMPLVSDFLQKQLKCTDGQGNVFDF